MRNIGLIRKGRPLPFRVREKTDRVEWIIKILIRSDTSMQDSTDLWENGASTDLGPHFPRLQAPGFPG
jgi:hypothetical protein